MSTEFDAEESVLHAVYKNGEVRFVVPEPTEDQLFEWWEKRMVRAADFAREMQEGLKLLDAPVADGDTEETDEERSARIEKSRVLRQEAAARSLDEDMKLAADVCSQQPPYEELRTLRPRQFRAFEGYLSGVFGGDPKA